MAQEVRNLAQRSGEAAREISDRINDASAKSTQGVQLTTQVSESLRGIVERAHRLDVLTAGMAAAVNDQQKGIAEGNRAITNIDRITQSTAAMAENSAEAAVNLQLQAGAMQQTMQQLIELVGGISVEHQPSPSVPVYGFQQPLRHKSQSRRANALAG